MTTRKMGQDPGSVPATAVVWPSDTADRADAQEAVDACREVWRRAYLQLPPTNADRAFVALHSMLTEQDVGGNEAGSEVPLAASI